MAKQPAATPLAQSYRELRQTPRVEQTPLRADAPIPAWPATAPRVEETPLPAQTPRVERKPSEESSGDELSPSVATGGATRRQREVDDQW